MKSGIHPEYVATTVTCNCGNSFVTRSTKESGQIHVEICSNCHPFYTGMQNVPVNKDGAVTGKPAVTLDGKPAVTLDGKSKAATTYGRLSAMSMINPQLAVAGTVNKDGGKPVSSDDRVVLIVVSDTGGGPGKD